MIFHFIHLIVRVFHGMPVLVSSNWASWLVGGVVMFALVEVWKWSSGTKGCRWKEWWEKRKSSIYSALAFAFVYGVILFCWSSVQTVYDDHKDNTGRLIAVLKERNNLYARVASEDNQLRQLQSRSCPICPARSVQATTTSIEPKIEIIRDVVAEARVTCTLKNPSRMPEDSLLLLPSEDSYMEGPTKTILQSRAAQYRRTEEEGKVTAIEEYRPAPNSQLIGMRIASLANYTSFHLVITSVAGKMSECTYLEFTFRANGKDVFREGHAMGVTLDANHGITGNIPLHDWKF